MATMQRLWWVGLTGLLGIYYLLIGLTAGGTTAVAAILGAVLIVSALVLRTYSRPAANALLVIGALPLGILTWWSLIAPIVAVLALICGGLAIGTGNTTYGPGFHLFARNRRRVM